MFEHHSQPLLTTRQFLARMAKSGALSLAVVGLSLAGGMLGYHCFEGMGVVDAFLNTSMLLGGMGPVNPPVTAAGKVFAGMYALYCGLIVVVLAGIIVTPVAHRVLHKFHRTRGDE